MADSGLQGEDHGVSALTSRLPLVSCWGPTGCAQPEARGGEPGSSPRRPASRRSSRVDSGGSGDTQRDGLRTVCAQADPRSEPNCLPIQLHTQYSVSQTAAHITCS